MTEKTHTELVSNIYSILHTSLRNDSKISTRIDKNIHVSDLPTFCARNFVLNNFVIKRKFRAPRDNMFNYTNVVGHLYHTLGRNLLGKSLIGNWECLNCGNSYVLALHPEECNKCGCKSFSYKEYRFELPIVNDVNLIGSIDAILNLLSGYYIIEMKSIKLEYYEALFKPDPAHVRQLNNYLWLASKTKHRHRKIHSDRGFIVYLPKQTPNTYTPLFKIYEVESSNISFKLNNSIINEIKEAAKTKNLPRRICVSQNSRLAKHCNKVKKCMKIAMEEEKDNESK